jgi:DNA-binding NtrC family response regulator
MEGRKVLVVDDEQPIRDLLEEVLQGQGMDVTTAADGRQALNFLEREEYDVLLTDLRMPGADGLQLLEKAGQMPAPPIAIVCTGHGSIDSAVQAMRLGAFDYITKPLRIEEIRVVLEKAIAFRQLRRENVQLHQHLREKYRFENLVGHSEAMMEVLRFVERVADTDSTVLICGESGTGKELIARALHFNSRRRERPLVVVNCSAIPQELLESELFGHEQGAFTGAIRTRVGKFETAHGGSVFLDEIGDMSPALQAKLLRVLQEQEVERVGGARPVRVDVRIIAATHRDLEKAIRQETFREDLYYRLNVLPIRVPPLRERVSDIPLLVSHFLNLFNRVKGKRLDGFAPEALQALLQYPWPGNVRELEHLVERMVVLKGEGIAALEDLPEPFRGAPASPSVSHGGLPQGGFSLPHWIQEAERTLIIQALERSGGVRSVAAGLLGIHRTTLVEKMRKLGLSGRFKRNRDMASSKE